MRTTGAPAPPQRPRDCPPKSLGFRHAFHDGSPPSPLQKQPCLCTTCFHFNNEKYLSLPALLHARQNGYKNKCPESRPPKVSMMRTCIEDLLSRSNTQRTCNKHILQLQILCQALSLSSGNVVSTQDKAQPFKN